MDPSMLLNNAQLKNISPEKLQFLLEMTKKGSGSSPQDMMAALMAASSAAQKSGVGFDSDERELIIEVLKQNMSREDQKKADLILNMFRKNRPRQ